LCALGAGQVELEPAWYCPEFGRRERCTVVRWTADVELPVRCGWWMNAGKKSEPRMNADGRG